MKATFKRTLSGLLALVMVLSLLYWAPAPEVSASNPTSIPYFGTNLALGKSVTFDCADEIYPDSDYGYNAVTAGLSVLTDGEAYSPNWWVNNGNPYIALNETYLIGPYVFTIDLEAEYRLDMIRVFSYCRPEWNLYPADAVTFSVSTDGKRWDEVNTVGDYEASVATIDDPHYPGSTVDIYCYEQAGLGDARYVRATFDANYMGLFGIGEIEVYGDKMSSLITQGASISYFGHGTEVGSDANWGSAAVKSGLSVLTDGVGNSPNWWVNNGNPNIGLKSSVLSGDYVFNLDIGAPSSIDRISTYFYSRTDWGVDAPDSVTYSVSSDGIIWKEVGSVSKTEAWTTTLIDERNPDAQSPTIYTFTLEYLHEEARYIKVSFGANALGMIGLQEIQAYGVKRTITNLSQGRPISDYQITGGGTGYESTGTTDANGNRYTVTDVELASNNRLTDGVIINSSAITYPSNWSSQAWNSSDTIMSKYLQIYRNDSRIITLDLGTMRNVTGIRMHFAAQESMGFYMPTNVTFYLSEDGVDYFEVADTWNYQTSADPNDSNISGTGLRHCWYPASGINYNARYVKVIFPVNVYLLSDELQVFGSEIVNWYADSLYDLPQYDPLEDYVGHFANTAQSGGVRNEFMAYSGWYINSDGSEVYNTYKTEKEYMTSIAYIDANGVPQDWLFDDVTVMGHYYTSSGTFNSYKAGYTEGKYYANQNDWYEWLCYAFGKDVNGNDLSYDGNSVINLEALEAAATSAKTTLNDPDYKVGVKLVLYPAVEYQENWGTIDGEAIDFTIDGCGSQEVALANRAKAYQWYVDQAVAMWEAAGFQHLELTGFYYYEETIHESTDRIAKAATQELTNIVHSHATPSTNTKPAFDSTVGGRLYIYQLPFYQSEGYWNWAEYGFDYALMQPNYSFYDMYTLTQLKECADLCSYYGLGMQMEFGGTASTTFHEKFKDYLTYGKEYGYQYAVVSWYMSTWGCYSMAYNNNGTRYLYDMVYEFVQGQSVQGGVCGDDLRWNLSLSGTLTISGTGDMYDFGQGNAPWYPYVDSIKTVVIESGATSIGKNAFWKCSNISSVTIPEGVTSIGTAAFEDCDGLTSVVLPSTVTELGTWVFAHSNNLESINIPEGITALEYAAFYCCHKLDNVVLPESMKTLSILAFGQCDSLSTIRIPASVVMLYDSAFESCDVLDGIWVDAANTAFCNDASGVLYNKNMSTLIKAPGGLTGDYEIPDSVVTIGSAAFEACYQLTGVTIPTSVTTISGDAFAYCSALKGITIPASVTNIGTWTFLRCSSLQEIIFLGDAPTIDSSAFLYTTTTAYYPAGNATWTSSVMQNYGGTITWVSHCDHSYETVVTAPTCTEAGYTTYTCANCGDSYVTDEVPALGHSYTATTLYPPTCANTGLARYTCSTCQDSYTEAISAKGHNYVPVVTAPTCTADGYTTYTCSNCSDNYTADTVSATGHAWADGTCTTCGTVCAHSYDGTTCTVCGMERTDIVVATNTVTLTSGSTDQTETVTYTPDADGILTIHMFAADPGWGFQIVYPDGSSTLRTTGNTEESYEYEVTAGETYEIIFTCYDKAGWSLGDGEISYEVTFKAADIGGDVVMEEYIVSDTQLYLGENAVTLEPNATTTIFAFTPDETGTYKFTADDGVLLGYWGSGSFYLNDYTADKANTLEYTITSVGQSIMLGVSGAESCNILIEKTADYVEQVIETIVYENTHEFGTYTFDQNALVAIDIFDDAADVAVLGADGFYHYGSANGPIIVVNLNTIGINVKDAALNGQLTAHVTNADGVTVKYDYNTAMTEYCNQGLYPVTAELAMMLQQVGATRGWYIAGGFLYPDATEVDQEIGWMGICSYVSGTEVIVPTLTLKYPTLAFEDEILYNAYFTVDDASSIVEMGMITFSSRLTDGTIDDAVDVIPGYYASGSNYIVHSNGIPAKNLGDALYFKVYAKLTDGTYVYTDVAGYNAVAYANSILNNAGSTAKAKSLVVAMLNYGAAAQVQFNYNTGSLMNANLTAAQKALVSDYDESMVDAVVKADSSKVGVFVHNGGYTGLFPTVSFEGAFSINYYFTTKYTPDKAPTFYIWDAETYANAEALTPENAVATLDMVLDGTQWAGTVAGIAAKEIDQTYYTAGIYTVGETTYYSPVVSYSLGSYCETLAGQGNAFGAATAVYGYYAKAFFAK